MCVNMSEDVQQGLNARDQAVFDEQVAVLPQVRANIGNLAAGHRHHMLTTTECTYSYVLCARGTVVWMDGAGTVGGWVCPGACSICNSLLGIMVTTACCAVLGSTKCTCGFVFPIQRQGFAM